MLSVKNLCKKNKAHLAYVQNELHELINLLKTYTKRAYLVGGSVRDIFLLEDVQKIKDFDLELYDLSKEDFILLMQKLSANEVGKSFFVYKYKNFDLALPRKENKIGLKHQDFAVEIINDEAQASRRRDFTMNALMLNIFSLELLDFYGGLEDIENRILRIIDEKSFAEDALRALRAVQFSARFSLKIEEKSLELMKSMDISFLSSSRISTELIKFFRAPNLALGFFYFYELNYVEKIFKVKISQEEFYKIYNFLKRNKKTDERFFLYVFINLLKIPADELLQTLELSNKYKSLKKEIFIKELSPFIFCKIALKIPLSSWLGLYNEERISLAKKLKIYDEKLIFKVKSEEFKDKKGKEIAQFIEKKEEEFIKNYLLTLGF